MKWRGPFLHESGSWGFRGVGDRARLILAHETLDTGGRGRSARWRSGLPPPKRRVASVDGARRIGGGRGRDGGEGVLLLFCRGDYVPAKSSDDAWSVHRPELPHSDEFDENYGIWIYAQVVLAKGGSFNPSIIPCCTSVKSFFGHFGIVKLTSHAI